MNQSGTTNHSEREGRARKGLGERAGERERAGVKKKKKIERIVREMKSSYFN